MEHFFRTAAGASISPFVSSASDMCEKMLTKQVARCRKAQPRASAVSVPTQRTFFFFFRPDAIAGFESQRMDLGEKAAQKSTRELCTFGKAAAMPILTLPLYCKYGTWNPQNTQLQHISFSSFWRSPGFGGPSKFAGRQRNDVGKHPARPPIRIGVLSACKCLGLCASAYGPNLLINQPGHSPNPKDFFLQNGGDSNCVIENPTVSNLERPPTDFLV